MQDLHEIPLKYDAMGGFGLGSAFAVMSLRVIFTGRNAARIREFKRRLRGIREPQYRESAARVSESFKACGGAAEAKAFLEQLAKERGVKQ